MLALQRRSLKNDALQKLPYSSSEKNISIGGRKFDSFIGALKKFTRRHRRVSTANAHISNQRGHCCIPPEDGPRANFWGRDANMILSVSASQQMPIVAFR